MDTIHSDVRGNEHERIVLLYLKVENTLDVTLEVSSYLVGAMAMSSIENSIAMNVFSGKFHRDGALKT